MSSGSNTPEGYTWYDEQVVDPKGQIYKAFYLNLTPVQIGSLELQGNVIKRLRVTDKYGTMKDVSEIGIVVAPKDEIAQFRAEWSALHEGVKIEKRLGSFTHSDGRTYEVYVSDPLRKGGTC